MGDLVSVDNAIPVHALDGDTFLLAAAASAGVVTHRLEFVEDALFANGFE
jgi:hypothetical protein